MTEKKKLNIDTQELFQQWLYQGLEINALKKALVKAGVLTEEQLRQAREETKREAKEAASLEALQRSNLEQWNPTKKGLPQ